jgi:hypothetical protein
VKSKVRLDLVFRRGRDECVQRTADRFGIGVVRPGRRERGRLALDSEPEVEHVEDVVVGPDGRGLDRERRRLGHRKHERAPAVECFDKPLGPQPGHRFADHRPGHPVLLDELGLRGQLVAGRQVACEDIVLQPGHHALRQCRGH